MTLLPGRLVLLCCALLALPGVQSDSHAAEQTPAAPAQAAQTQAAPIRISTSELPPLSMEHRPGEPGALFEMVEELMRRTGDRASIEFVPWRRAIFLSTSRPRSAVFPLTRSPEREARYRWLAPLYSEPFTFMSLKGGNFDTARPELGKTRRIGILRGSLMIEFLHEAGYPHLVEAASVEESLRFLRRGIVDAVFGSRDIYQASLGGHKLADYPMSPTIRVMHTWLGGSLDFTEADAARYEQGMNEMIEDGTYARLLKKYKLEAPQ